MKFSHTLIASVSISTMAVAPASAERFDTYDWKYYNRLSVPAKAYIYFPTKCLPSVTRAFSTYNSAGSRLVFNYQGATSQVVGQGTENTSDLIVATGALNDPTALAEAPPQRSSYSTSYTYGPGFYVSDVDIIANANRMFYSSAPQTANTVGDYFCPSSAGLATESGKYDFETVMLHEIGHANGLSHFTPSACTMYKPVWSGVAGQERKYCKEELAILLSQYGSR